MNNGTTNVALEKRRTVFHSDDEVEDFLKAYCDEHRQMFIKERSQKLSSTNIKYKSEINKNCTYYFIEYKCKYGLERTSVSSQQRKSSTFKRNCKAYIKFKISKESKSYIISDFNEQHSNHNGLEKYYEHLPEKRCLNKEEKTEALKLLSLGCKPARLQLQLRETIKKEIRRKDLINLNASNKCKDGENINQVIELLQIEYGATANVLHEDKVFAALYFSTDHMRLNVQKYGQIVFVDCTYKIFKAQYSLMLFVIEDGEGRSQVVAVAILINETKPVLKWVVESFKNDNDIAFATIKGFMTDKDMTERNVLKEVFPHADMFICQFHTLRTFSREICTRKMSISMEQRETSLLYIDRMVKSCSEDIYLSNYEKFEQKCPKAVKDYFNANWHPYKNEWTKYSIFKSNYGNLTNNRIESMNSKLKGYLNKYNSLVSFINDFFQWDKHRGIEMSYTDVQKVLKIKVQPLALTILDEYKKQYEAILTDYASKKVSEQLDVYTYITIRQVVDRFHYIINTNGGTLNTTPSECTCFDRWSMQLPCRHIFAVRKLLNMDLFSEDLCDERWKKQPDILPTTAVGNKNKKKNCTIHKIRSTKKNTIGNKRKKLKLVTNELISLASEQTEQKFQIRLNLLSNLKNLWKANETVKLVVHEANNSKLIDIQDNENEVNLSKSFNSLNISEDNSNSDTEADPKTVTEEIRSQESVKIIGKVSDALSSTIKFRKKRKKCMV